MWKRFKQEVNVKLMFEFCQTVQFSIYFSGIYFFIAVSPMLVNINYRIIHNYHHLIGTSWYK